MVFATQLAPACAPLIAKVKAQATHPRPQSPELQSRLLNLCGLMQDGAAKP